MRYFIALTVAGLLVGGVSMCFHQMSNSIQQRMRQRLIDAKHTGDLPSDIDVDRADFTDFGQEVSASELQQIRLLDSWFAYRIFLIPAVIVVSLAVAHVLGGDSRIPLPRVAK